MLFALPAPSSTSVRACVRLRNRTRPVTQDLTLAAREVVVRQPRDLVVQTRAALVVEPDGGQRFHICAQAPERLLV